MNRTPNLIAACVVLAFGTLSSRARAENCNLKIVTDASPDYSDMPSLIHSVTSAWATPAEKCWAMYYWNHIGRRQTTPMCLHGNQFEMTDPIRQFNDYGFTQCSMIAGINTSIWANMGLKVKDRVKVLTSLEGYNEAATHTS